MWMLFAGCLIREDVYLKRKAELEAMEEHDTGGTDTGCIVAAFVDADRDGWGNAAYPERICRLQDGYAESAGDCDDGDAAVYPGAVETCATDWDDDCDGSTDGAVDAPIWYADEDGDGFGDIGAAIAACDADGRVADATDCDDDNGRVNPGEDEVCGNGLDDDCDEDVRECRLEGEFAAEDADVVWEGEGNGYVSVVGDLDDDGLDDIAIGSDVSMHLIASPRPGTWTLGATDIASALNEEGSVRYRAVAGDFDGDGLSDVAVWTLSISTDESAVEWFSGPLRGELGSSADRVVDLDTTLLGYSLTTPGDTTGDGRDELWVGAPNPGGAGTVRLVESQATVTTIAGALGEAFGLGVATLDADNDGGGDVLVAAPYADSQRGKVCLFLSPSGDLADADADVVISGEFAGEGLGGAFLFAPAGDVDGDGWVDLWLPAPDHSEGTEGGGVYLLRGPFGGSMETSDSEARFFGQTTGRNYGASVTVGDVDADGAADILIGAHVTGGDRVLLMYGPAAGTYGEEDLTAFSPAGSPMSVGFAPAIVGDVDGDGGSDFLLFDDSDGVGAGLLFTGLGQ